MNALFFSFFYQNLKTYLKNLFTCNHIYINTYIDISICSDIFIYTIIDIHIDI